MIDEGIPSHSLNIPLVQVHEIGRVLIELQVQMRKLTLEAAQIRELTPQNPYRRGYNAHLIDNKYTSSHEDFDDEEERPRRRSHRKDDLWDFKVEAPKFDGSFNPENYLDWVQAL